MTVRTFTEPSAHLDPRCSECASAWYAQGHESRSLGPRKGQCFSRVSDSGAVLGLLEHFQ